MSQPIERKDGYYGSIFWETDRNGHTTARARGLVNTDEYLAGYLNLIPETGRLKIKEALEKARFNIGNLMVLGGAISDYGKLFLSDIRSAHLDPGFSEKLQSEGVVSVPVMTANKYLNCNLYRYLGDNLTPERINFYAFKLARRLDFFENGDGNYVLKFDGGKKNLDLGKLENPLVAHTNGLLLHLPKPLSIEDPVKPLVNQTIMEISFWMRKGTQATA